MKRILKYELDINDAEQQVPAGEVVHVGQQADASRICIWIIPSDDSLYRVVRVVGTGHPLPENFKQALGSVVVASYGLVWHVVEVSA